VKLSHAVETEKGLALMIGDIGTGKTTLSRRLLDQLIDNGIEATLLVIIHSEITSLWFLKKIALMLETPIESENKIEIITAIYHRLLDITGKDRKVVILIDEANMLQTKEIMEEIRGLLNLESEYGKLLNFILFGLPEMEDYLKLDPPLYQRIAVRCVLDALDAKAAINYIIHRLRVAGCMKPLMTKEALERVYTYSKGIPRTINAICDNALLEGFLLKREVIEAKIIDEVSSDLGLKVN
jgi:type II secretory pathway predicted ATPase ExeA